MDAAGIDKDAAARHLGFPAPFGQSPFAITRGNAFEAQVKADGCAELLRLLRDVLGLPIPEVAYDDLDDVGGNDSRSCATPAPGTLLDARRGRRRRRRARCSTIRCCGWRSPGTRVYLEPDLIAFQLGGRFHVVEIKSFAVIDGQADPAARSPPPRASPPCTCWRCADCWPSWATTRSGVPRRGAGLPGELRQPAGRDAGRRAQAADACCAGSSPG